MPFAVHYNKKIVMLICSSNDVNLDYIVKMVSVGSLLCKWTFSFIITKYVGGDTLRLCKYSCFCLNFCALISAFIGGSCLWKLLFSHSNGDILIFSVFPPSPLHLLLLLLFLFLLLLLLLLLLFFSTGFI